VTRVPPRYLDREDQWVALAKIARNNVAGLDSEFFGCDLSRNSVETTTHRARVHVWSVAFRTAQLHPRGYHLACSYVMPAEALFHPDIVAWLTDPACIKWAHNKGMEIHAIENTWRTAGLLGSIVLGVRDTLSLSRWCLPARVVPGQGGYALDDLGESLLGRGKTESFEDILAVPNEVEIERRKTTHRNVCICGATPCRQRISDEHRRERVTSVDRWTETVVRGTRLLPLETIRPGHERWPRLVPYAGVDAELALELEEYLMRNFKERVLPW
jgi:hypothetical protein